MMIEQGAPEAATEAGQPGEGFVLDEEAIFLGFKHEVVVR
jgi:hypothetical protein